MAPSTGGRRHDNNIINNQRKENLEGFNPTKSTESYKVLTLIILVWPTQLNSVGPRPQNFICVGVCVFLCVRSSRSSYLLTCLNTQEHESI